MSTVNVQELFFVINMKTIGSIKELPRIGYSDLREAIKAQQYNGDEYEVKSYYYLWNIIEMNLYSRQLHN